VHCCVVDSLQIDCRDLSFLLLHRKNLLDINFSLQLHHSVHSTTLKDKLLAFKAKAVCTSNGIIKILSPA
jgi:hypothetical protein